MIRGVAVTPNRRVISVVICDDDSETIGMIHLAAKEGADIELIDEVVADVAVVTMPKLQMTNGAVDNVHTYELTKGTELLNNGKAYMKQEIHIIDFKKYLVAVNIDICF